MEKLKSFVIDNSWMPSIITHGWGNGYVAIPEGHPLHGIDYRDNIFNEIEVHGGLTYGDIAAALTDSLPEGVGMTDWVLGFDTAHYMDDERSWPESRVRAEAEYLRDQLEKISI